jgi:translation elongation factor EF-Tu-like GTPase
MEIDMDNYDKGILIDQLSAVLEDFPCDKTFRGVVNCTAVVRLSFSVEVDDVEVEGSGFDLVDDASVTDRVRLVIRELLPNTDEEAADEAIIEAAKRKVDDLDVDELVELAETTGEYEIDDVEFVEVVDAEEV